MSCFLYNACFVARKPLRVKSSWLVYAAFLLFGLIGSASVSLDQVQGQGQAFSSSTQLEDDATSAHPALDEPPYLVSEWATLPANHSGPILFGLVLPLNDGWKTYWRDPGDAGLPTRLTLRPESRNVRDISLQWPLPERMELLGLSTFGYGSDENGSVVLPVEARAIEPDQPLVLEATADYLVCKTICLPMRDPLSITLEPAPSGDGVKGAEAELISQAMARVPPIRQLNQPSEPRLLHVAQGNEDNRLVLEAQVWSSQWTSPELIIEDGTGIAFEAPVFTPEPDIGPGYGRLRVSRPLSSYSENNAQTIRLTLYDGKKSAEFSLPVAELLPLQPQPRPEPAGFHWIYMLSLALLGGFILNLMPCVLPVLSLKIIGILQSPKEKSGYTKGHMIATAAGILFTFWLFALAAWLLRQASIQVGWGMQFHSPLFAGGMMVALSIFIAHLLGLFSFPLPAFLAKTGALRTDYAGSFLTGVTATLLATPCTAPFLGTAIGFALTGNAFDIAMIFTGLGVGMALPYLIIALFWRSAGIRILPKPGPWLAYIKPVMSLPLLGTMLWLCWILSGQVGTNKALIILAACLTGLLLLAGNRLISAPALNPAGWVVLAAALILTGWADRQAIAASALEDDLPFQAFEPERIPQLVEEGKTVFVDITAKWCLTCQWNKSTVLLRDPVRSHLMSEDIVLMQGDWTLPDPEIADYLNGFNRFGIPFNAVYSLEMPHGHPLPELLSQDNVLRHLPGDIPG